MVALFTAQAVIYFLAKYAGLTVNGQSQGILTVLVIGAGTDYALLLVARYREELRRHEDRHEAMAFALHRAAPGDRRQRARPWSLGMLCLLLAEMNSTAGLGPVARHRHRRRAAGDDHAAAGAAGHLRPLGVLAQAARRSARPSRPAPASGPGSAGGSRSGPARSGSARPRPWRVACLGVLTLDANGLSTEDSYTKEFDSIIGQQVLTAHGLADQSNPLMVVANADQGRRGRQALVRGRRPRRAQPADRQGRRRLHRRPPIDGDAAVAARRSTPSTRRAHAVHAVARRRRAGRRHVGDLARRGERPPAATTW